MDIKSIYTNELHNQIVSCMSVDKLQRFPIESKFIKLIRVMREGVLFHFNTKIPCRNGITKEGFLNMNYDDVINELEKAYEKTQNNSLYQLSET